MNPPSCPNCGVVWSTEEVQNNACDVCKYNLKPKSQTKDEFPTIMDLYKGVAKHKRGKAANIRFSRPEFKNNSKPKNPKR